MGGLIRCCCSNATRRHCPGCSGAGRWRNGIVSMATPVLPLYGQRAARSSCRRRVGRWGSQPALAFRNGQWPASHRLRPTRIPNPIFRTQIQHIQEGLRRAGLRDHAEEDTDFGIAPERRTARRSLRSYAMTVPGAVTISTRELTRHPAEERSAGTDRRGVGELGLVVAGRDRSPGNRARQRVLRGSATSVPSQDPRTHPRRSVSTDRHLLHQFRTLHRLQFGTSARGARILECLLVSRRQRSMDRQRSP